jgi:putative heme-binding domain-containing protein
LGALTPGRRTLVISTARQSLAVNYPLTLPTAGRGEPTDGGIKQVDAIDLAYDLSGAAVEWQPNDASRQKWVGHVPHLDLSVARTFTAGSAEHEALWPSISQPGRLTVRTSLDLWNVLRPEVQPGSRVDYTLPPERVTVTLESNVALEVRSPDAKPQLSKTGDGQFRAALNVSPKEAQPLPIELTFATGQPEPTLTVTLSTEEDPRPRAIPLRRFLLPWAAMKPERAGEQISRAEIPQLKGGDWLRGRDVFFGQQAGCATCHRVDGRGGDVGPDLSNLVHRDYDSVLRDIQNPSGALNPDYISSTVMLKDGRIFNGIFRSFDKDHFMVRGDAEGEEAPIHRRHIETITPSGVSMMPPGLDQGLGGDKTRDLLTFLLTRPLEPAPPERPGAPTPRSRAELEAVLSAASESDRKVDTAPLRVLLAAGPKDHGPGEHDYPKWQQRWSKLLAMSDGVRVSTCNTFRRDRRADQLDIVLRQHARIGEIHGEIQSRLAADRRQNGVGPFLRDDRFDEVDRERLDVGAVGELGVGHDRRWVAVDENDLEPLGAKRLTGLGTGVVELAGLADDDRTGADHEDAFQVGTSWHKSQVRSGYSPTRRRARVVASRSIRRSVRLQPDVTSPPLLLDQLDEIVEQIIRIVRTRRRFRMVLDAEYRVVAMPQTLDRTVVQIRMRHLDIVGQ